MDRAWAVENLIRLSSLLDAEGFEAQAAAEELIVAGIAPATIERLYPLTLSWYVDGLSDALRDPEILQAATANLLLSKAYAAALHIDGSARAALFERTGLTQFVKQLLVRVRAMPEKDLPGHFIIRVANHHEDLLTASGLLENLGITILLLHLIASGSWPDAQRLEKAYWQPVAQNLTCLVRLLTPAAA